MSLGRGPSGCGTGPIGCEQGNLSCLSRGPPLRRATNGRHESRQAAHEATFVPSGTKTPQPHERQSLKSLPDGPLPLGNPRQSQVAVPIWQHSPGTAHDSLANTTPCEPPGRPMGPVRDSRCSRSSLARLADVKRGCQQTSAIAPAVTPGESQIAAGVLAGIQDFKSDLAFGLAAVSVPESPSAVLLGCGMAVLSRVGRRRVVPARYGVKSSSPTSRRAKPASKSAARSMSSSEIISTGLCM